MIDNQPLSVLRRRLGSRRRSRIERLTVLGLSTSIEATLLLTFTLAFPNRAHATEACGQALNAFERVDPGDGESGVGGTGHAPEQHLQPPPRTPFSSMARGDDESGIGGTGRAPSGGDESGIGGTGILGTVLHVDRLCVNGFEIQVPATLQIESAMGGDGPLNLTVGQIVFIRALRTDSTLIAQRIQIQRDLGGAPWENGPPLELLSIEGFVSAGPGGPRLGRFQLDFGSSKNRPDARDLRPGTRVRAIGRPERDGILRIAPPLRPARPQDLDRATNPPSGSGDARDAKVERPEPKPDRRIDARPEQPKPPARPDPPSRPERPEVRPDRVLPDRPLPRVIERPDIIDRASRR